MATFIEVPTNQGLISQINVDHIRAYHVATIEVPDGLRGLKKQNVVRIFLGDQLHIDTNLRYDEVFELVDSGLNSKPRQ